MNSSFLQSSFSNNLKFMMNSSSDLQKDGMYDVAKKKKLFLQKAMYTI